MATLGTGCSSFCNESIELHPENGLVTKISYNEQNDIVVQHAEAFRVILICDWGYAMGCESTVVYYTLDLQVVFLTRTLSFTFVR